MEYKKCRKKFCLAFKKKIGEKVITNKRKFEVEKAAEIWNPKKQKWTKTANQMKWVTKHWQYEKCFLIWTMKANGCPDFISCIELVERCEELFKTRKFDIEGNDVARKIRCPKESSWNEKDTFRVFWCWIFTQGNIAYEDIPS